VTTYFEVFGLPEAPELDGSALERKFRELSLQLHPDRLGALPAGERRAAVERSTLLNDAYKTLKDETRRAFYLLRLQGVDLDRDDGGGRRHLAPEFLEEILELREQLEDLSAQKDLAGARRLADDVLAKKRAALEAGKAALAARDVAAATAQLAQVRYFQRFLEQVDALEEESL
jgi:molecular chaperone HscB